MTAAELLPDFREQFPEFDVKTDDEVTLLLNKAILIHAICPMATVYLAAHFCVLDTSTGVGGSGGSVDAGGLREKVSESGKSISSSFAKISQDGSGDALYTNSPYGRTYIMLRNHCPGAKFHVRVA